MPLQLIWMWPPDNEWKGAKHVNIVTKELQLTALYLYLQDIFVYKTVITEVHFE
jgi:hypothetical protein